MPNATALPTPRATTVSGYTIDVQQEHLLAVQAIPAHLEKLGAGRIHVNGARRWTRWPGVRGVVLPTVLIGGRRFTTTEALIWFIHASSSASSNRTAAVPVGAGLTPADARTLREAGIIDAGGAA